MDALLDLFVPGQPRAQGSKRAFLVGWKPGQESRPRVVLTEEDAKRHRKKWRKAVCDAARLEWRGRAPLACAVRLEASFSFLRPKSHLTSKGALTKSAPREAISHNLGDMSKLLRSIEDSLQDAGVIADDCQIVSVSSSKRWDTFEGVRIVLSEGVITQRQEGLWGESA